MEFIRGTILTGFPWNLIAFSFSNQTEILSIISLIGTYGFNLFCISLFTCPALIIFKKFKKKHCFVLFVFCYNHHLLFFMVLFMKKNLIKLR